MYLQGLKTKMQTCYCNVYNLISTASSLRKWFLFDCLDDVWFILTTTFFDHWPLSYYRLDAKISRQNMSISLRVARSISFKYTQIKSSLFWRKYEEVKFSQWTLKLNENECHMTLTIILKKILRLLTRSLVRSF